MSELVVDLFVEDRFHELLVGALVKRVADGAGIPTRIRVRSARGGHGRAVEELRLYQQLMQAGAFERPQLIIAAIDANCQPFVTARQGVLGAVDPEFAPLCVVACPDPHVERWLFADPVAFDHVVGVTPKIHAGKCKKDFYKDRLRDEIRRAGAIPTLGGLEYAEELAQGMDLYRASKNDSSLSAFVGDLRHALTRFARK